MAISYFNRNQHTSSLPENFPNVHAGIQFQSATFFLPICWYQDSLRNADVFPVVASLPPREATTGNTSAFRSDQEWI